MWQKFSRSRGSLEQYWNCEPCPHRLVGRSAPSGRWVSHTLNPMRVLANALHARSLHQAAFASMTFRARSDSRARPTSPSSPRMPGHSTFMAEACYPAAPKAAIWSLAAEVQFSWTVRIDRSVSGRRADCYPSKHWKESVEMPGCCLPHLSWAVYRMRTIS